MNKSKGKLYIVPTPIGNLKDITYRAVEVLGNCDLIAAEDTRTSYRLLQEYSIKSEVISYHKYNEKARVKLILEKLNSGLNVAIISDAGTPGISDPAKIIVQAAIKHDICVEALPGATAFVPALVASGLETEKFTFIGFLPDKQMLRNKIFTDLKTHQFPIIFYESPRRIDKFLHLIYDNWGDRKVAIAREISKIYETYYRNKVSYFLNNPEIIKTKGEFVIIVDGAKKESWDDEKIKEILRKLIDGGESPKLAIKKVSKQSGENKNHIYDLALEIKDDNII